LDTVQINVTTKATMKIQMQRSMEVRVMARAFYPSHLSWQGANGCNQCFRFTL
jgi:hypothetical protein